MTGEGGMGRRLGEKLVNWLVGFVRARWFVVLVVLGGPGLGRGGVVGAIYAREFSRAVDGGGGGG